LFHKAKHKKKIDEISAPIEKLINGIFSSKNNSEREEDKAKWYATIEIKIDEGRQIDS
jgi:hypothetical protein